MTTQSPSVEPIRAPFLSTSFINLAQLVIIINITSIIKIFFILPPLFFLYKKIHNYLWCKYLHLLRYTPSDELKLFLHDIYFLERYILKKTLSSRVNNIYPQKLFFYLQWNHQHQSVLPLLQ